MCDKFHLIQSAVEACEQITSIESRAAGGKRDQLARTRWMWLKNQVKWTGKKAPNLKSVALDRCVTGMAYDMRLALQGIYECMNVEKTRKRLGNWCVWVRAKRD